MWCTDATWVYVQWYVQECIYIDYRLDDVHSMLSVVYMVYCRQMEKMDILECC